ncbi:MAG: M23 family metallopeptidase [Acidimicrobiales bacterium]
MTVRIVGPLIGVVIALAACGGSDDRSAEPSATPAPTTTQSTTTTSSSAPSTVPTTAASQPVEATAPPPESFDVVVGDFAAGRAQTLQLGRSVVDQFLNDDLDDLYARVSDEFATFVSLDQLRSGRTQLETQAPLGRVGAERAVQLSPQNRFYAAEIGWGDGTLGLTSSFGESSEINGLLLTPQPAQSEDPVAEYLSPVPFRLPFEGVWFTFWGGDTAIQNYHVAVPVQRHAFDFLIWKNGGTHAGDGTDVTDYWTYGQRVVAPAAGTVVTIVDGLPDQVPQTGSDTVNPAGNHVVIEVAPDEFIVIAHLQAGSILVEEGDGVQSGQPIGLVGNSGTSTEPHIPIHLQDAPEFSLSASGLPLEFTNYWADGAEVVMGQPLADEFVAHQGG